MNRLHTHAKERAGNSAADSSLCMISLCDETGIMAEPWAEAGYTCYCVDLAHSFSKTRIKNGINFVYGDARSWTPPAGLRIAFVAAFPPCTHVAGSGAAWYEAKRGVMLRDALETFEACRQAAAWSGAPYMIENPVGILSSLPHIGKPNFYFNPCDYGDPYTKKTCLWTGNGFVMPPKVRVEPTEGSKMQKLSPGPNRAKLRSVTPRGFARAVFAANGCKADVNQLPIQWAPAQVNACTGAP